MEYEGLYKIYFDYGKYGHKSDECSGMVRATEPPAPAQSAPPQGGQASGSDSGFGPWMLPRYHRKRVSRPMAGWRREAADEEDDQPQQTLPAVGLAKPHPMGSSLGQAMTEPKPPSKDNRKAKAHQSRFGILEGTGDDEDWDKKLEALKEKVHSLPGPNRSGIFGPAHGGGKGASSKSKKGEQSMTVPQKQTVKVPRMAKSGHPPSHDVSNRVSGNIPQPDGAESAWQAMASSQWMKLRKPIGDPEHGLPCPTGGDSSIDSPHGREMEVEQPPPS